MTEVFHLTNRSGQNLVGAVWHNAAAQGLVFLQHGLSGYRQQPFLLTLAKRLFDEGLTVVTFDAANSFGASDGELSQATLTRHHHDLVDIIGWSRGQSWCRESFFLVGHSLGGASVLLYALAHPHGVKGIAALSPVTGYRNWAYAYQKYRPADWALWQTQGYLEKLDSATGKRGVIGQAYCKDLESYDLIAQAPFLRVPVFVLGGDQDPTTPFECLQELFAQLPKSAVSRLVCRTGAPHTFKDEQDIQFQAAAVLDWLKGLI